MFVETNERVLSANEPFKNTVGVRVRAWGFSWGLKKSPFTKPVAPFHGNLAQRHQGSEGSSSPMVVINFLNPYTFHRIYNSGDGFCCR